jgi:hypothetical protein
VYANEFYTNAISVPALDIGNLMFRDNEITTTTGSDLYIDGNGAGGVRLGNFKIVDNVITNLSLDAISEIIQSGTGYFKIQGTNGFVPPTGSIIQRPSAYAVLGMTRYNTDSKALEIWNGVSWASPAGSSGSISTAQAEDIALAIVLSLPIIYSLMLPSFYIAFVMKKPHVYINMIFTEFIVPSQHLHLISI